MPLPSLIESPSTVTVAGEAAVHAVEAQQVGVGLDRAEIVDADDLDILAARLGDGAQHVAADAAKSVDRDANCHVSPLKLVPPRGFPSRRVLRRNARFGRAGSLKMGSLVLFPHSHWPGKAALSPSPG